MADGISHIAYRLSLIADGLFLVHHPHSPFFILHSSFYILHSSFYILHSSGPHRPVALQSSPPQRAIDEKEDQYPGELNRQTHDDLAERQPAHDDFDGKRKGVAEWKVNQRLRDRRREQIDRDDPAGEQGPDEKPRFRQRRGLRDPERGRADNRLRQELDQQRAERGERREEQAGRSE